MKIQMILISILIVYASCTTEKKDVHKAYWVEEVPADQNFVHIIDFNTSEKQHITGTLIFLSDHKNEKKFEIKEITIKNNNVNFHISETNASFEGKISDDGFSMNGVFTLEDGSKQNFVANKTMDEHYDNFRDEYLKK